MAGTTPKTGTRKAGSSRPTTRAKAGKAAAPEARPARAAVEPAPRRIERSLDEGTTESLQAFRTSINWS